MTALKTLADRTKSLFQIKCRFICPRPVLVGDNAAATHLYRIAQEAITNAIKHGRPGLIKISLSETPGRISLAVKDDGTGIPHGHKRKKWDGPAALHALPGRDDRRLAGRFKKRPGAAPRWSARYTSPTGRSPVWPAGHQSGRQVNDVSETPA